MRHTEEDWERLSKLDKMYLQEKENEMIEEWMEWEEEQQKKKRLPAKIVTKMKKEKDEKVERK